ncbi:hypothetical protein JXM83_02080 [Candidatus Woesearchaeota archaeon]|nr:hypothetical protein [Candidatus Woesearchaeota archaeon]
MKKQILPLLLLFIILIPNVFAYYADLQINVDDTGKTTIKGVTNNKAILTQDNPEFTTKKGRFWTLNITTQDIYDPYNFKVSLPKNSVVNYMKVSSFTRIENSANLNIYGAGTGKIVIILQYQIKSTNSNIIMPIIIGTILLLAIITTVILKLKKKKTKLNFNTLTPRQQEIVKILQKNKGQLTQSKLEKISKLPKSSLSRNIESLKRKNILEKTPNGMSNTLILKNK